jgi:hypothetical protein
MELVLAQTWYLRLKWYLGVPMKDMVGGLKYISQCNEVFASMISPILFLKQYYLNKLIKTQLRTDSYYS